MEILLDLMNKDELGQVMEIERKVFDDPWSFKSFLEDLRNNKNSIYLTASRGRKVVGYIGAWFMKKRVHITNLAVDPEFQRKKVASTLLSEILRISSIQRIEKITLEVRASNKAAISLYKKHGFKILGYRKKYYNNQEDALVMGKELKT